MQTLIWIKQRLGGERLVLLQYVMKCWKGVIKERNARRQTVMERIGRCWQAQLPLKKVNGTNPSHSVAYCLKHVIDDDLVVAAARACNTT